MKKFITYVFILFAAVSCMKESYLDESAELQSVDVSAVFGCQVEVLSEPVTKSNAFSSSFDESKITSLSVAVYDHSSGVLHMTKHFTSGFSSMEIKLRSGSTFDLYAVANMGDQTANMPQSRSDMLSNFSYSVPSYSDVNTKGLPMSGRIENFTVGTSTNKTFNMKRLFAKVTLNVTTQFNGGTNNGIKVTRLTVSNANKVLSAFGQSKMESTANKISSEDYATNNSVNASSIVFYVPENMQGTIGTATSSRDKNPDRNSAVNAKKDYLTYVDVTVSANSTYYTGTVHYRSYIGTNATTNFDVKGNYQYVWNMTLTEDGLVDDDWKIDQDLTDGRYLYFTESPVLVEAGEQISWSDILETNILWSDIADQYSGTLIYSSYPTSTGFTVKSSATAGSVMNARVYPLKNYSYDLDDAAEFHVIERYIRFDDDVYAANPRKSVDSGIEYGNSFNGAEIGFGGFSSGTGVKWTVTPPAGLPHTSMTSSNMLDYSYNSATDVVTWTPSAKAVPGDYTITCQTLDGKHSDSAILRVNDTRWVNTDRAYDNLNREQTIQKSSVNAATNWYIGYAFGDLSNSDSSDQSSSSPNAHYYLGNNINNNWQNYIGYRLVGNASDYLTLNGTVYNFEQVYKVSSSIPIGDYRFEIYWKDTWDESLQDYTIKDYAVLHITGTNITSITIPSTLTVRKGETVSLTATVLPTTASVKRVTWNTLTGSDKASVTSNGDLVASVVGQAVGTTTVKAVSADGSGVESNTCTITVVNPPVSLSVTPAAATINVGTTQQFVATVTYYDGTTSVVTTSSNCSWSSNATNIATIGAHTGLATASSVRDGRAIITASYTEGGVTVTDNAILDVQDVLISTTTETEYDTQYQNLNLADTSEDTDYTASVKINNKTSETVDSGSHTVTITKSGTHTHTVYSNVQPQKRDGTRTREKYTWATGDVTYGSWSAWTWGAWTNNGSVVTTQKSRQTGINDASSMTISGFTPWFTSSGSVSANSNTTSRTATLSVTNGTASASATLTQSGQSVTTEYELVLDGTAVTTKVGKSVSVVRTAKFYTITKVNGVETGRTYTTVNATLSSNNTSIATVNNSTSKVTGVSVGTTSLKGTYTYGGHTYTATNTIGVTVKSDSGWGVDDDDDPGSGSGEGGDYNNN